MITLSTESAILVAVVVTLVVMGWGIAVSVGSAVAGSGWAVQFLAKSQKAFAIVLVAGVGAAVAADPSWLGLLTIYSGGSAMWLAWAVRRRVMALRAVAGDEPVDPVHQARVMRWAGYGLGLVAVVVGFAASLAWSASPPLTFVAGTFSVAALLSGLFLLLRAQNLPLRGETGRSENLN